ncbi:MAG: hypothetical protein HYY14_01235 [Candidatus Omnitrophica bacterium]|nr:hypothetical protein [Candidatus Omnitrophota bacterium]
MNVPKSFRMALALVLALSGLLWILFGNEPAVAQTRAKINADIVRLSEKVDQVLANQEVILQKLDQLLGNP